MNGIGAAPQGSGLRWEVHYGRLVRAFRQRPSGLHSMFLDAVAASPDAEALVDGDLRLTYQQLDACVGLCAGRLAATGLARGDRVGILLGNRADFVCLLIACARLGLISVPLNVRQSIPELAHILEDSGARVLFAEADLMAAIQAHPSGLPCRVTIAIDDKRRAWHEAKVAIHEAALIDEDEPCSLVYTSGTTGKPKGAVLTHFGVVANCMGSEQALGLELGESSILAVPLSHVTGLVLVVCLTIRVAGKVVMLRHFKAPDFLSLAEHERMTYTVMVPAMYKLCLMNPTIAKYELSAWRAGAFGGAPMPEAMIDELAERFPGLGLFNIYGATETTAPAVVMPSKTIRARISQVGRPLAHCEIRIMDEAGCEVSAGQPGEIWISGPMVVPGYWNNAEATGSEFVGGYWKSGDVGAMDTDGYLSISDRTKDVINRGGFKIYSVEVENALMRDEAVIEAAAVPYPCPVLGERIATYVVIRPDAEPGDLRALCARWLSDYKVPDRIEIVGGPLPRNANGKLLKREIRKWAIVVEQDVVQPTAT